VNGAEDGRHECRQRQQEQQMRCVAAPAMRRGGVQQRREAPRMRRVKDRSGE